MFRRGHTILEVVISIGILAVATVSVGSLVDSLRTTDRATTNKAQASVLAQQGLEIATAIARDSFRSTSGPCSPAFGYTSCWNDCPVTVPGCTGTTLYQVSKSGSTWSLISGSETIGTNPAFSRQLTITPVGSDQQVKQITAKVSWTEKNRNREAVISTIVSAWQD